MSKNDGYDDEPEYEVDDADDEVGNEFGGIDLDDVAYSVGRTLRHIGQDLGLVKGDPSPYIVKPHEPTGAIAGHLIWGVILMFLAFDFVVGAIGCIVLLSYGSAIGGLVAAFIAVVIGIKLFQVGLKQIREAQHEKRFCEVLNAMRDRLGKRERISLSELAGLAKIPMGELESTSQEALRRGYIPEGRLAIIGGVKTLYLTDGCWKRDRDAIHAGSKAAVSATVHSEDAQSGQGVAAEQTDAPGRAATAASTAEEPPMDADVQKLIDGCASYVERIRKSAGHITDSDVSIVLNGIADKVETIYGYVVRHPDTAPRIRRLSTYYLPTTVKLAESYDELEEQGSGPQATSTRQELRETLGMVYDALSKFSDNLLQEQAMDLKSDMDVMKTMLEQDGLSDSQ